jgi:hypothetical protein
MVSLTSPEDIIPTVKLDFKVGFDVGQRTRAPERLSRASGEEGEFRLGLYFDFSRKRSVVRNSEVGLLDGRASGLMEHAKIETIPIALDTQSGRSVSITGV